MFTLVLFLHVLGATIWTGGHLVLSLTVLPRALRGRDPEIIRQFEQGYEKVGIPALLMQVVTGLWLAYRWLPDPGQWISFGTSTGSLIGLKLGLLFGTVVLALHAPRRFSGRLDGWQEKRDKAAHQGDHDE